MSIGAAEIAILSVGVSNLGVMVKILINQSRSKSNGNGKTDHNTVIIPHSEKLKEHDGEIKNLGTRFDKLERENRDDHQKLFGKFDEVKDLIIERTSR